MDNRQKYITVIGRRLAYLSVEVGFFNTLNLTDINVYAENFYRDFLNLLGYEFVNTNLYTNNFAYIDLIDTKNKIAIQVTSQNDNGKIKGSIEGFFVNPKYKGFKLKILLISKDAKDYRTKFGDNFNHKEDVLDIKKLLKIIENKELNQLELIADFLNKQILQERKKTESKEVETIMTLIDYLSQNKNRAIFNNSINVDPKNKIENRFAEHSDYLKQQYADLLSRYQKPLIEAKIKIDTVDAAIISDFLRDESDLCLTREKDNPKLALAALVDFFYEKLSENGMRFDKQAIKFYFLDELINCNVFPNK